MSTPTAPTFFTVIADYKSVVVDIISDPDFDPQLGPISARVTFTPLIDDGEVIAATHTLPRPTGFIAAPIEGRIDTDGKLKLRVDPDGTRLDMPTRTSFPAVGAAGRVYHAIDNNTYWKWDGTRYAETFSYTPIRLLADTSVLELAGPLFYRVTFTDVVLNGRPGVINPFTFQAPTSDVEVNLITVGAVPGQPASGITKIAPTGVRLNASGQIVFTFGGVDLPDPLTLSTVSSAGATGPTGPAGPKGDKGDPGPKGDAGSGTAADLAATVVAATAITTPADADVLAVAESASSLKKLSWAALKAALLAWFGPVTATLSNKDLTAATNTFPTTLVTLAGAQSLSNKTIVSPTITTPTVNPVTAAPNALVATFSATQIRAALQNTALGTLSHSRLTTGNENTTLGFNAQSALTTGTHNTAVGRAAQGVLVDGIKNSGFGAGAHQQLTAGSFNTAVGTGAQHSPLGSAASGTTTASKQTSVGMESGQLAATQVDGITTVGYHATSGNTNGVAVGILSRCQHDNAVALGANTNTTADNQVAVGPRDIEISDATKGVVLRSPDGKRWRITVSNAGAVTAAAV